MGKQTWAEKVAKGGQKGVSRYQARVARRGFPPLKIYTDARREVAKKPPASW